MWFAHGFPCPVEDQEDVVEAMRLDAVDEMTEQLQGTGVGDVDSTDYEKEDSDDERTGCGGTMPPCYEMTSSFGLLESAAEEGGNDDATFHLPKARMSFVEAYASKQVRQTDNSFFFSLDPRRGGEVAQQSCAA